MKVLVTGVTGFAGPCVVEALLVRGFRVRGALREANARGLPASLERCIVGDIGEWQDWSRTLEGVDVVVHLAARVHVMRDSVADPLEAFRRANVVATDRLAQACVRAGVRRFVFASSIKVNGESTEGTRCFDERSEPAPQDPYGVSKLEAEQLLRSYAARGLHVTVLRPPLMYGPGVKGNMLSLIRALERGVPLPLGGVRNTRSLLGVRNFADAVATVLAQTRAAGGGGSYQTYLLSDRHDVSTPDLIRLIACAGGWREHLPNVPTGLLRLAGTIMGRAAAVDRLCGSLRIDSSLIGRELGWRPPVAIEKGMAEMVEAYRSQRGRR